MCKSNAFANLCCGKISKITFLLLSVLYFLRNENANECYYCCNGKFISSISTINIWWQHPPCYLFEQTKVSIRLSLIYQSVVSDCPLARKVTRRILQDDLRILLNEDLKDPTHTWLKALRVVLHGKFLYSAQYIPLCKSTLIKLFQVLCCGKISFLL